MVEYSANSDIARERLTPTCYCSDMKQPLMSVCVCGKDNTK